MSFFNTWFPRTSGVSSGASVSQPEVSNSEERHVTRLELHYSMLDREYLQQLAAQTAQARQPCSEAETTLEELAKLSLNRLKNDYTVRREFIDKGRDRAKEEFDRVAQAVSPRSESAQNTGIPATENKEMPMDEEGSAEKNVTPDPNPVAQPAVEPTPSPRELQLKNDIAGIEKQREPYANRLAAMENLGYSPGRSAAMRVCGFASLAACVVSLAIVFDSFTKEFPLFGDLVDSARSVFLPAGHNRGYAAMAGFGELVLLFILPVAIAFFLFRQSRSNGRWLAERGTAPLVANLGWPAAFLAAFLAAILAAFSKGETTSRLLLDFALALGCVGASSGLILFCVTRSASLNSPGTLFGARWERTVAAFALIVPVPSASSPPLQPCR